VFHRRSITVLMSDRYTVVLFNVSHQFYSEGCIFFVWALSFVRVDLWCVVLHFYARRSGFQMEKL
jgi:hypothetical protein